MNFPSNERNVSKVEYAVDIQRSMLKSKVRACKQNYLSYSKTQQRNR